MVPPRKLEYDALLKFKQIDLSPSIDGVGTTNELLRYPASGIRLRQHLTSG